MNTACIEIARYRYSFSMRDAIKLPAYAGSLLRGQFGAALRRVSCMTRAASCEGCPLLQTCPYSTIFESPATHAHTLQNFSHVPHSYVIEPPPIGSRVHHKGELLQFNIVLIGTSINQLPLISFALEEAFRRGVGPDRSRGELVKIEVQDRTEPSPPTWCPIWEPSNQRISDHDEHTRVDVLQADENEDDSITLHFKTPLRLQVQGKPVSPQDLTPRKLIADLLRRITLLRDFHLPNNKLTINVPDILMSSEQLSNQKHLHWYDWKRFSSRQQQEMKLGGMIGEMILCGNIRKVLPFIKLGELIHVGKNATLGLGQYDLITGSQQDLR